MTISITEAVQPLRAATDPASAGRKAATLARLTAEGLPVPDGVVLTSAAFATATSQENLAIADELLDELCAAVRPWGDVPLAVRSSGVDEDSADASFAGLFTTVLGVRGRHELAEAVLRCWRSAFDDRVTGYANGRAPAMAVLVQPIVDAVAAGVAFTADPVTGRADVVVIDAVTGLAERLVSGAATPQRWTVEATGTSTEDSVSEDALGAEQARQVAELARRVEEILGGPLDIEWAMDGEQVMLLQARPVTTLPAERITPIPLEFEVPDGFWEREASHAPAPWTPLSRVMWSHRSAAMRHTAGEFGLLFDGLEFADIGGWEYTRVVPFGGKQPPKLPAWAHWLGVRLIPALRKRCQEALAAHRNDAAAAMVQSWYEEWLPELTERNRSYRDTDVTAMSDERLSEHIAELAEFMAHTTFIHMRLHGALALSLSRFALLCEELLGWDDHAVWAALAGTSHRSTEPARALAELSTLVDGKPRLHRLVTSLAPLSSVLDADQEFRAAFEDYLSSYGCRALRYEAAEPALEERPELVLTLIRDQLAASFDPATNDEALAGRREAAVAEARARLANRPAELRRFEERLAVATRAYPVREDNEFFTVSVPVALIRRAAREAGRRLTGRGQFGEVDDVFFLEFDELRAALADRQSRAELVTRRRGERAWVLANPGPASYGTAAAEPPPLDVLPDGARQMMAAFLWTTKRIFGEATSSGTQDGVNGTPASAGSYTGPVRVIMDESQFDRVRAGDVLVCPTTSPVWSVLFPSLGALVTDSGGSLSHPAIIAREYRLPAVVATREATQCLHDGQLVTVDGSTGTVRPVR